MTTSIDLSVDELLLLEENQYQMSNFVFPIIKPIGAERKIGQSTHVTTGTNLSLLSTQRFAHLDFVPNDRQENKNSFDIPSSTMSSSDHFHFSPLDESIHPSTTNQFGSLTYSCSSASSTSGSSTAHSPRSSSHLLDNYIYQRQISTSSSIIQQKSISTRTHAGKVIPAFCVAQTYPTSRFYAPQHYTRNSFLNICQPTRSTPPMFSAPFQCTRERFQVNSIGRPILRPNISNPLSSGQYFKVRR